MAQKYDVENESVRLAERMSVDVTRIRDTNVLVDAMGPEEFGPDERMPYWASLWPASEVLAKTLYNERPEGPAIELGAGLGLCSVALALTGAQVTATDYEQDAVAFIRHNAKMNGVDIETHVWDWREKPVAAGFQTAVLSDVLYEPRHIDAVADAIQAVLAPQGVAWVSDPGRVHIGDFERALLMRNFSVDCDVIDDIIIIRATPPPT